MYVTSHLEQTPVLTHETRPHANGVVRPRSASGLIVIIPFYRNEDLVAPLFESLTACSAELRAVGGKVIAINDSPGYAPLAAALTEAVRRAAGAFDVSVRVNATNQGFVHSVNHGLELAIAEQSDALLLNSDTILFPGAISEMARIAQADPMIGFVNPRSNNATLASLPVQTEYRRQPPGRAFGSFTTLAPQLPEYTYVPTACGFCMLVKNVVLREFGMLDGVYGKGYNEENDLVMRANRCGYRAALANRAFVYHTGETSFTTAGRRELDSANAKVLVERYPEYPRAVSDFFTGAVHRAESRITALLPDSAGRHDLLFDFSDVGSYHNGTIDAAKSLLHEFARTQAERFNLAVIIHADHARYHGLDKLSVVQILPVDTDQQFAVGLRVGQPMTLESFSRLDRLAVRTAWFMLDTITWDCQCLVSPEVDPAWRKVFDLGDAVIYNSEFTRGQFASRFPAASSVRHLVSPHSLDPSEYLPSRMPTVRHDFVFVVGNRFPHKFVGPTVDALAGVIPDQRIVCVGLERHAHHRVVCHSSGNLSDEQMESFYAQARFIVFPSHYEGFGLPLLKGMAYEKPVLMRDGALSREMKRRLGNNPNIILYEDTDELLRIVRDFPPAWQPGHAFPEQKGWARSAGEVVELVENLIAAPDAFASLTRRIREAALMEPSRGRMASSEEAIEASLSPGLRAVRSAVVRAPWLRSAVRPFWRLYWRMTH